MATYKGVNYGGLIAGLKTSYVNIDLLFNTRARKAGNQKTAFRTSLAAGYVKTGTDAATGVCGGIPVTCASFDAFEVTADKPIEVNAVYEDCLEDFVEGDLDTELNIISKTWAEEEARGSYEEMLAAGIIDVTEAEGYVDGTAYEKVMIAVSALLEEGWALADILVVVSDAMFMKLAGEDITCCEWNIATSEAGAKLVNKLGVKGIIHLPTNVISGGVPADASETVETIAYVKDLAMFLTYCEDLPEVRSITDIEYTGTVTQIIGKEFYGFGIADITSAAVGYAEAAVAAGL